MKKPKAKPDLPQKRGPDRPRGDAGLRTALCPSASLLAKLGSVVVHAEEFISPRGHDFDVEAIKGLLNDPELTEWLTEMRKLALVPEKR